MKKLFILSVFFSTVAASAQSVAINTDGSAANATAILDLTSITKGFLLPRMTESQRNAIAVPPAGLQVWCTNCGTSGEMQVYNGTTWTNMVGGAAVLGTVTSTTGRIWMDRNLGATQVATSSTDAASYGNLYQWGRGTDGHEKRTSNSTTTSSSTDVPGHGLYITSGPRGDWRTTQNDNLWQVVNGVNNPCPSGYRIPTETELNNERLTWSSNNVAGAFNSLLKLPAAGIRFGGGLNNGGFHGRYWGSTVTGTTAQNLFFDSGASSVGANNRDSGFSVRCIKD